MVLIFFGLVVFDGLLLLVGSFGFGELFGGLFVGCLIFVVCEGLCIVGIEEVYLVCV